MANFSAKVKGSKLSTAFHPTTAHLLVGLFLLLLGGIIGAAGWWIRTYQTRIYPGVFVDNVLVGGLTPTEAETRLRAQAVSLPYDLITLEAGDKKLASSSADLGLYRDYTLVAQEAFAVGRTGPRWQRGQVLLGLLWKPHHLSSRLKLDPVATLDFIATFATTIDNLGEEPSAKLTYSGSPASIVINKGKVGSQIDQATTLDHLQQDIAAGRNTVTAVMASVSAELTPDQITAATERAKLLVGKSVIFKNDVEKQRLRLSDQEMVSLLQFPSGYSTVKTQALLSAWEKRLNRSAQDAEFEFNPDTLVVTKFKAPRNGLSLNRPQTETQLLAVLNKVESDALQTAVEKTQAVTSYEEQLALTSTAPHRTLEKTNNLGIKEMIGFGESEYAHSIPSRVHNVALAAKKIDTYIIKPDEEFSFNKALGDVSGATGFKPAYVIQSGRTVLGDGGGVCQVSTTLFRSVLNAGLPVTKRKAHSYRVSYYELDSKPGVDATVYSGEVDLRFKNDTGHHILIHTETDSKNLYMKIELYGTSDGRTTQIVDHKTWDFRPAPAPQYIPDPSLPPGKVTQVDWAASGIKASFKNIVKDKQGNVLREEEYFSNYIPWSAKYLRGV